MTENNATQGDGSQNITTINRVSVKVPPFWNENPQIWFSQVEAQFSVAGISLDATKFNTVVAAMESKVLSQISDAVINPPPDGKYDNLKTKLLERFGATEQENLRKLFTGIELGDKKPSQLLQEMRHLGGQQLTEPLLQNLWMNRLPTQVSAILQSSEADLNGKATLADKILEVTGHNMINQVGVVNENSPLQRQINELSQKFQQFMDRERPRSRSKSRSNFQRDRSVPKNKGECWYHRRFGKQAKNCVSPCSQSSNPKN